MKPQLVGKVIRIRNKFPGPPHLFVNTVSEGLRPHLHLCLHCQKSRMGESECRESQTMNQFTHDSAVGLIVVRCPQFEAGSHVYVKNTET